MQKADKPADIFNLHKVLLQGGSQSFPLFRNCANVMFVGHSQALEDIEEVVVSNINETILVPRTIRYRIQKVKSFAIPKVMSKATLIPVSSELIKEVNKELYSFIWKGKDKFKRSALINDSEDGGLKMLDPESMIMLKGSCP